MKSRLDATHSVIRRTGIPDGWTEYAVGDVVKMFSGGTPDRKQGSFWRNGTIPWITPTDLTANANRYISSGEEAISEMGLRGSNATLLEPGTIIFSSRGTVGKLAIAAVPLTINQSCEALRPKWEDWSTEFLYYLLGFGMSAFHRLAGGTTFGAITRREIARVRFAFPPPDEQAAIALVLDAVDTTIERTRTAVAQAEQLRDSLLLRLLKEGIDKQPSKKTSAGWIAESWRCEPLGKHISDGPSNGLYRPESDYGTRGNLIVRIDSFADGRIHDLEKLRRVLVEDKITARFALREKDILINRVNALTHIGKSAIVPPLNEETLFESNMMLLRCADTLLSEFLILILCSDIARRHWLARAKSAVNQASINQRDVCSLQIPMPEPDEQRQIVSLMESSAQHIQALKTKIKQQNRLKTALLQDLLTGKVRVGALAAQPLASTPL